MEEDEAKVEDALMGHKGSSWEWWTMIISQEWRWDETEKENKEQWDESRNKYELVSEAVNNIFTGAK